MQEVTSRIVLSAVEADQTITADVRQKLRTLLQTGATHDRILSAADVGARAGRTKRTINGWAKEGILPRVVLPGRTRGIGFRESDVVRLISGMNVLPSVRA